VTILDENGQPNNGPFPATTAILRLHSDTLRIEELFEYYMYGHFMKFIPRGAVRIESTLGTAEFNNIAFLNPDGAIVLVVVNTTDKPKPFAVVWQGRLLKSELGIKSVATLVWR